MDEARLYDLLEAAAANVSTDHVRFGREWFYVASSIMAWIAFWQMADRHQHEAASQRLAWLTVLIALWAAWAL